MTKKLNISNFTFEYEDGKLRYVFPFEKSLGKYAIDFKTGKVYKSWSGGDNMLLNEVIDKGFIDALKDSVVRYIDKLPKVYINLLNDIIGNDEINIVEVYKNVLDYCKTK